MHYEITFKFMKIFEFELVCFTITRNSLFAIVQKEFAKNVYKIANQTAFVKILIINFFIIFLGTLQNYPSWTGTNI